MASTIDEEADEELLEQLKVFDEINTVRSSYRHRFFNAWKSLKLRSALGHIGLMLSLSVYCVVGGIVSMLNMLLLYKRLGLFKIDKTQQTERKIVPITNESKCCQITSFNIYSYTGNMRRKIIKKKSVKRKFERKTEKKFEKSKENL